MDYNKEVAMTIINQIGGVRTVQLMTGVKQFMVLKNGVGFQVGRKIIKITLNSLDYYDVEVGHSYKYEFKSDKIVNNIDCEQLKSCVETLTGYSLTIPRFK